MLKDLLKLQNFRLSIVLFFLSLIAIPTHHTPPLAFGRLVAIITVALVTEHSLWAYRKITPYFPAAAIVTSFVIFLLADPEATVFQIFLATILAIASKHYIARSGSHIFNPAAFGLFIASLFGLPISWWGFMPGIIFSTIMILTTGFISIYSLRQEKIVVPFLVSVFFLTFFLNLNPLVTFTQFLVGGFWFFTLVMLVDPPTAPQRVISQFAYGIFVGALSFLLPKTGFRTEPLLTALLLGNLVFWLIEGKRQAKEKKFSERLPLASKLVSSE